LKKYLKTENNRPGWACLVDGEWNVYFAGSQTVAQTILGRLKASPHDEPPQFILSELANLPIRWGFIAANKQSLFAATDRIRSFPVFYTDQKDSYLVSNSARALYSCVQSPSLNIGGLLDFRMAGYTTGHETLISEIHQLQAGELLFCAKKQVRQIVRYYRYLPHPTMESAASLLGQLQENTESNFKEIVKEAHGRQIVVPLSSGLDSRLILGLLKELKYKNVFCFSYGPRGNHEARIARQVACHAGYPWNFVPINHALNRKAFLSKEREAYWQFSDNLCAIPSMQDILPIQILLNEKKIRQDAIMINGQTGDFISGGHIPPSLISKNSSSEFKNYIFHKHYALRKSLCTLSNRLAINDRLEAFLAGMEQPAKGKTEMAGLYESWEWQERQCKYVVNGQRIYDWLGLEWRLPLWETRYLDFWAKVPWEMKLKQRLYKEYLQKSNYGGLFQKIGRAGWPWFGWSNAVPPTGKVLECIWGTEVKDSFYSFARYWGYYGPQYGFYGIRKFYTECKDIRNVIALYVDTWIQENKNLLLAK